MTKKLATLMALAVTAVLIPGTAAEASFPGDNGRIAFAQQEFDPEAAGYEDDPSTDVEVYTVAPEGGDPEQTTSNEVSDFAPQWSPDGTKMAVLRNDDIYILNADGSDSHALGVGYAGSAAWAPDGRRLVFEQHGKLFVTNADGSGDPRRIGRFRGSDPTWSPTGGHIAFTGLCMRCSYYRRIVGLFTVRPDGTGLKKITHGWDYGADWSPDGRRLVFLREQRGGSGDGENSLMRVRADGTRPTELIGILDGAEVLSSPVWAPDGTMLAVIGCSFIADDGCWIFTLTPDGGNVNEVTSSHDLHYEIYGLSWQPL